MRFTSTLLLILCLTACQRGVDSKEAVRQGVVDYLASQKFDMSAMDVKVTDTKIDGEQADAQVVVGVKGKGDAMAMNFSYHLQHQGSKWVVTGKGASQGASPHGAGMTPATPGTENPHGGEMPGAAGGGSGKMPSPDDLPPAKK